jgi:hypothetical protein
MTTRRSTERPVDMETTCCTPRSDADRIERHAVGFFPRSVANGQPHDRVADHVPRDEAATRAEPAHPRPPRCTLERNAIHECLSREIERASSQ